MILCACLPIKVTCLAQDLVHCTTHDHHGFLFCSGQINPWPLVDVAGVQPRRHVCAIWRNPRLFEHLAGELMLLWRAGLQQCIDANVRTTTALPFALKGAPRQQLRCSIATSGGGAQLRPPIVCRKLQDTVY